MAKRVLKVVAPLLASILCMTGCCSKDDKSKADAGTASDGSVASEAGADASGLSFSCYIAAQFTCNEYPNPTPTQMTDAPVACASLSGVPSQPAACPMANFKGKCARPNGPTVPGPYIERFYQGADLVYAQDFCVNTARGVWSTTF